MLLTCIRAREGVIRYLFYTVNHINHLLRSTHLQDHVGVYATQALIIAYIELLKNGRDRIN